MNRGQIVEAIASNNGLTKTQANKILATTLETIQLGVKKEGTVRIPGFGTFSKHKRAARKGVNPSTGEKIKIAAKTVAKFRPSKSWEPNKVKKTKTKK